MLNVADVDKVYLACGSTDLRKSIDGLTLLVQSQLNLDPFEKALFVFVDNTLPTSSTLLSELYANHKSQDVALRMTYTSENTFGAALFKFI